MEQIYRHNKHVQGFTLIELIMVIVLVGVLATMTTEILIYPVNSYLDQVRRTTLVTSADMAINRIQRDIRQALPNSIRINAGGTGLELLHIVDGGRYRKQKDPTAASTSGFCASNPKSDELDFIHADSCFEVLGTLRIFNPLSTNGEYLVIYNLNSLVSTANAYFGDNRTVVTDSSNINTIQFNALKFPYTSPSQRFYLIDTPITYRCDLSTQKLLRYQNYAIALIQPDPPGVSSAEQVRQVSACSFSYVPGTASRAGLVTISLTLTDSAGESISLLQQVHVDNVP